MPSKPTAAQAAVLEVSDVLATESPVEEAPAPVIFDPATDDEDDDDNEDPDTAPTPPPQDTSGIDVAALVNQFAVLMAQRDAEIWERLEERLAKITPPSTNGHAPKEEAYELAGPPGVNPDWMTMPHPPTSTAPRQRQQRQPPRMVAFIPKADPYNPRQTTFKTWRNGREIRAKRGQVMILTMPHGVDLAKNGHGNCVDILAMQGSLGTAQPMNVQENPDYSRPSDWDGMPLSNRSSVPVGR